MELFTSDQEVLKSVSGELTRCGCCARCILRYLGAKDMYTFRGETQEMEDIVKKLRDPVDEDTDGAKSGQEQTDTSTPTCTDQTDMETSDNHNEQCEQNCEHKETEETLSKDNGVDSESAKSTVKSCVVCLGILEQYMDDSFLERIKKESVDKGFHFTRYLCSLMVPVCIILREHALLLHLKEKFKSVYGNKSDTDISPVKDIWKWKNGPLLNKTLNAPFDFKSSFDITLTFDYQNSGRECSFLLDSSNSEAFRKRKQDRRFNKKKVHALYTRANVGKAIEAMKDEEFRRSFSCPPHLPTCASTCDIKCQNENVFVAGRYNKYSRELSQTPWIIDGERKSESSVEELLAGEITKHFQHIEQKFSSSGREDVDVRMLGQGRPFVLELVNPKRREFTQEVMSQIEKDINTATKDIRCRDLQIVSKEETEILKQGEIDKVKWYRALCWSDKPVTDEQLGQLGEMKDLKILQKTPIRVLHRRPLATRDKLIHTMKATRVDETHFSVDLSTQAGTYIKEFVHGDFGRTKPNLCIILGVDCDILELDVTAIELDWPKKITSDEENQGNDAV